MSDIAESLNQPSHPLVLTDASAVPAQPDPSLLHRHRRGFGPSVRELWARREIVLTLAERDIRANYKETTLGVAWAVLTPLATLVVMIFVFKRVKSFGTSGIPYPLFAYMGILPWQFFASSLSSGGNSLLANKQLLAKVHFPRECFPLAQILESGFATTLALPVLALIFGINHRVPHEEALWVPVVVLIEIIFSAGVVMGVSALLVHVRDLVQTIPVVVSLGMFLTPVIWPFSKLTAHQQMIYGLFNPVGPVIDNLRRTALLGLAPTWKVLGVAAVGALLYFFGGYALFRRLEADLADIA